MIVKKKRKKKTVLRKQGMIESTTIHKHFLDDHESAFSLYDFGVPGIVHFQLFEVPQEPCLNEVRYCNKQTPLHLRILLHVIGEKKSLKK